MVVSKVYEVLICDPAEEPNGNEYEFFICPGRNFENEEVVKTWAQGWIKLDSRDLPGFTDSRTRSLNHGEANKLGPGYDMGRGIRIWITKLPIGSKLHDPIIRDRLITQLRLEVSALPASLV